MPSTLIVYSFQVSSYRAFEVINFFIYLTARGNVVLLYLSTQKRFLIGGERVTCHWSKLNDALGRTKLSDALGKQYLELWTRT